MYNINAYSMKGLSQRTNINVYDVDIDGISKHVILYDDHRSLLNVLFYARMKGVIQDVPNLVYFDWHDDARRDLTKEELDEYKPSEFTMEEYEKFYNFVEFKLDIVDGDWLSAGMHYNLIKHALNVGGVETANIQSLNHFFNGSSHHIYSIHHLDFELSKDGCFGKPSFQSRDENHYIRSICKCNYDSEEDLEQDIPYVLDFDLDCFTGEIGGYTMAWPALVFGERYYKNLSARKLLRQLSRNAAFITICREPGCCGGLGESNKILSYLDDCLFEGGLHTSSIM